MATHDVAVFVYELTDGTPPTFRARCSCGWAGEQTTSRRLAHMDGLDHEDEALAATAGDQAGRGRAGWPARSDAA